MKLYHLNDAYGEIREVERADWFATRKDAELAKQANLQQRIQTAKEFLAQCEAELQELQKRGL